LSLPAPVHGPCCCAAGSPCRVVFVVAACTRLSTALNGLRMHVWVCVCAGEGAASRLAHPSACGERWRPHTQRCCCRMRERPPALAFAWCCACMPGCQPAARARCRLLPSPPPVAPCAAASGASTADVATATGTKMACVSVSEIAMRWSGCHRQRLGWEATATTAPEGPIGFFAPVSCVQPVPPLEPLSA